MFSFLFVSFALAEPPIVNGNPTSDWPAVGMVVHCEQQQCFSFCSTTLIEQNWLLTAGHCFYNDMDMNSLNLFFATGASDSAIEDRYPIVNWVVHPEYISGNYAIDIAVLELGESVNNIDPIEMNRDPLTADWMGSEITYVGYGAAFDDGSGAGIKRYAEIPIFEYDDAMFYTYDEGDDQNCCYGDSGGAALHIVNGVVKLAGVISGGFVVGDPDLPCEEGGTASSRVDVVMDFIDTYVPITEEEPEPEEPAEELEPSEEEPELEPSQEPSEESTTPQPTQEPSEENIDSQQEEMTEEELLNIVPEYKPTFFGCNHAPLFGYGIFLLLGLFPRRRKNR